MNAFLFPALPFRSLHVSCLKGLFETTRGYPGIANAHAELAKLVTNALFERSGHTGFRLPNGDGDQQPMPFAPTTSSSLLPLQQQPKSAQNAERAEYAARAVQQRPGQHPDLSGLKQVIDNCIYVEVGRKVQTLHFLFSCICK